jgi:hypothetical protein
MTSKEKKYYKAYDFCQHCPQKLENIVGKCYYHGFDVRGRLCVTDDSLREQSLYMTVDICREIAYYHKVEHTSKGGWNVVKRVKL